MELSLEAYQKLLDTYAIPWAIKIVAAIAIFIIGRSIAKIVVSAIKKVMTRAKVEETFDEKKYFDSISTT